MYGKNKQGSGFYRGTDCFLREGSRKGVFLTGFRSIADLEPAVLNGAEVIRALTGGSDLLVFSYSPRFNALMSWSNNISDILGVADADIATDGNLFLRYVHPDDRFLILGDFEKALQGAQPYRATYRWIRPDTKEQRWLHCRGHLIDSGAEPLFEGCILDLSEELSGQSAALLGPDSSAAIMSGLAAGVLVLDPDLRLVRRNLPADLGNFDFGDPDFHSAYLQDGRLFLDCFADAERRHHFTALFERILSGEPGRCAERCRNKEQVIQVEAGPLLGPGGVIGILLTVADISALTRLEEELDNLRKSAGFQLLAAGLAQNFSSALQDIWEQAILIKNQSLDNGLKAAGQKIISTVQHTVELTRQLFAANYAPDDLAAVWDLNALLLEAVKQVDNLFTSPGQVALACGKTALVHAARGSLVNALVAALRLAHRSVLPNGRLVIRTTATAHKGSSAPGSELILNCFRLPPLGEDEVWESWQTLVADLDSKLQISGGGVALDRPGQDQIRMVIFFPNAEAAAEMAEYPPDYLAVAGDSID